jgi:hypothetical protein
MQEASMPVQEIEYAVALIGLAGASIGAAAGLFGSWLHNQHDARQRERERLMALRRDVYLQAAEGIAGHQHFMAALTNTEADVGTTPLQGPPGWQNKTHVVASLPTIAALAQADGYFVAAMAEVAPLRLVIGDVGREIAAIQERTGQLRQYQGYLHTSLQGQVHRFPAEPAVALANQLRQRIDETQREIEGLEDLRDRLGAQRAGNIARLASAIAERVAQHRILAGRAILALRREIDLPLNERGYIDLLERTNAEVLASLAKFTAMINTFKGRPTGEDSGAPASGALTPPT